MRFLLPAAAAMAVAMPLAAQRAADQLYVNARVWTADSTAPSADAFLVRGDRFVAVGTEAAVRRAARPGAVVTDLGGRRVVPGFNDSHWHLPTRAAVTLDDAGNLEEIRRRLSAAAHALPAGAWLVGRGWSAADFPDNTAHRRFLDDLFPTRPVLLRDRDGHQVLVNGEALRRAHIAAQTPDPAGGRILHDADGTPTGVLQESATGLVASLLPAPSATELDATVHEVLSRAASFGLTMVQEASANTPDGSVVAALMRAAHRGTLPVRVRTSLPFPHEVTPAGFAAIVRRASHDETPVLRFGIVKGMLDGTVDAKTAAMLEPYVGGGSGLPFWEQGPLDRMVTKFDSAGVQVELHAIGDRAVRMALDAYAAAARANGTSGRRHRVEHIEVPALEDLPRFKAQGVIASTQAIFASPDATTLQNYAPLLGPGRASHSNAFKLFDDAGAVQAFGSDSPVFPMDPLRGIWTAVTRQMPDGTPTGGWYPEHRITVEAALTHFTRDAAYAAFAERDLGTITAGKRADFVVLSQDIVTGPPATLLSARVVRTVMGGRTTYAAP